MIELLGNPRQKAQHAVSEDAVPPLHGPLVLAMVAGFAGGDAVLVAADAYFEDAPVLRRCANSCRCRSAWKNAAAEPALGVSLIAQLLELGGVGRHVNRRLCSGCNMREAP